MLIWTSRNIPNVGLFSAYAEVFPAFWPRTFLCFSFLCLRRGVSGRLERAGERNGFSLPTQRCFHHIPIRNPSESLFSAYAEVFLKANKAQKRESAFLCLRRGVSRSARTRRRACHFSLPTQRCFYEISVSERRQFLFSAYAEVFLKLRAFGSTTQPFLCLRRGVSEAAIFICARRDFSLPTQRCFFSLIVLNRLPLAFLCLRRGVSRNHRNGCRASGFSLPTQRCFLAASPSL